MSDTDQLSELPPKNARSAKASFLAHQLEARQAEGVSRDAVIKPLLAKSSELDVAFLCDATGSMARIIAKVKQDICSMVDSIVTDMPSCKLRLSFVGYRDYGDTPQLEVLGFTKDVASFKSFVGAVRATGGDDWAEDVFTGLQAAQKLDWAAGSRVMVHLADAPCHGRDFHERISDDYSSGDKLGRDPRKVLKAFVEGCRLDAWIFCHLHWSTPKMISQFRALLGAQYVGLLQEHHDPGDLSSISKSTTEAASSSLSQTRTTGPHRYHFAPKKVDARAPSDILGPGPLNQGAAPAMLHRLRLFHDGRLGSSTDQLLDSITTRRALGPMEASQARIWVAPRPFTQEGSFKWPHHGFCQGSFLKGRIVAKRLKTPRGRGPGSKRAEVHAFDRYLAHVEAAAVACALADEFSAEVARVCPGAGKLTYLPVYIAAMSSTKVPGVSAMAVLVPSITSMLLHKLYLLEQHLPQPWRRFGNNAGWVNHREWAELAHAFSHWTHARSQGRLMVTDLQGCRDGQSFILSDPAIHCLDEMRFGGGNLGTGGMQLFLDSHSCGATCSALSLTPRDK